VGQTERLYRIESLLRTQRKVTSHELREVLGVTRATLNRDLALLRDRLNAPIVYDRDLGGYHLAEPESGEARHELPGLWFSSREIHALLAFHHFLEHLNPGLLSEHIAPLKERIEVLLESRDQSLKEITRRIRVLPLATRSAEPACFRQVAHALLTRQRLRFQYHGRGRGDITERQTSPQRLVHYRDNWYLDAWDHGKRALRTFAIERIREPRPLEQRARDISETRLDRHFTESYGIFAGKPKHKALLRFSPERARWVAEETWHPQQKGRFEDDHYILEIPYSDDRELVLDILKHGPEVEVIAPASLRREVAERLRQAVQQYNDTEKQR
jgi:predicted DNA-binding transcriptional regulator YafY